MSIYDIKVKDIDGNEISMSKYKGKTLLIVNVASKCGFTSQYEGLEKLYEIYKDQGLEVLGFPSNEFSKQEPGNEEEIKSFCSLTYNVQFDLFSKIEVNGDKESSLFTYLKENSSGVFGKKIKWNFTKFLVNKDGIVVDRFAPITKPSSLEKDIEKIL
ncbi:MAG: glutathione peroxidase [Arcobacter sp.]|nr:MAG: glutathione peroxidase [Arcobacter sp.]